MKTLVILSITTTNGTEIRLERSFERKDIAELAIQKALRFFPRSKLVYAHLGKSMGNDLPVRNAYKHLRDWDKYVYPIGAARTNPPFQQYRGKR